LFKSLVGFYLLHLKDYFFCGDWGSLMVNLMCLLDWAMDARLVGKILFHEGVSKGDSTNGPA
jgi:hypothetical protein